MKTGHQRDDGMVYYGLRDGHEVWVDTEAFDVAVKAAYREACKVCTRLRAALTERHREKLRAARAQMRKDLRIATGGEYSAWKARKETYCAYRQRVREREEPRQVAQ